VIIQFGVVAGDAMKGHALALASLPRYCFPDSCCLLFISTALWLGAAASPLQYRWSGGSSSQGPRGKGSHVTGILQVRLPLPGLHRGRDRVSDRSRNCSGSTSPISTWFLASGPPALDRADGLYSKHRCSK
jgi:hypothetical protein